MIGQLSRCKAFAAQGSMIDRAIRVSGNLGHPAVFGIHNNAAPSMAHATMTFNGVVKSMVL
jgi:hypothetical protein